MRDQKQHPLNDSRLFRIRSRRRLAEVLGTDVASLEGLNNIEKPYREFFNKSGRWIEDPKPPLKRVQKRFAELMSRIETPAYLHSAVKGRSYATNAAQHEFGRTCTKLDVKKFYRSVRAAQVFHFFKDTLEWAPDAAALMTKILTLRGHLPTGGNASPTISFWAYKPMFDELARLAIEKGCVFTVYVDDMVLTGGEATSVLLLEACKVVGSYRLRAHKRKVFAPEQVRIVTGIAKTRSGARLPFKRRRKIAVAERLLKAATSPSETEEAFKVLIGRVCEALEVDPLTWTNPAKRLLATRRAYMRSPKAGVEAAFKAVAAADRASISHTIA